MKTRVIFMGSPDFAIPILESVDSNNYDIIAVYTPPDRGSGRGRKVKQAPVKEFALHHGLTVVQPEELADINVLEQMVEFAPELIVVASYGKLLPREILCLPKFGCVNVHPSLLPHYRGSSPVATAILNGDGITGVTVMLMDIGLDTGPVLSRREMLLSNEDTTGSLTIKLARLGAELLKDTLPLWMGGKLISQGQNESEATMTRTVHKWDGKMDWHLSAEELSRRVRAFHPWPGCYCNWQGKLLKINKAIAVPAEISSIPGRVVVFPQPAPTAIGVECGRGVLGLLRVQLEGKSEVTADEFARGQRNFTGSILS